MRLVLLLLVLAVIGGIAVVAAGGWGGLSTAGPERSPGADLPDGPVDRARLEALSFTLALRGYRMDEVDRVLDLVGADLDRRDARIAELELALAAATPSAATPSAATPSAQGSSHG